MENKTLDLEITFEQAPSLDVAKKESDTYTKFDYTINAAASDTITNSTSSDQTIAAALMDNLFSVGSENTQPGRLYEILAVRSNIMQRSVGLNPSLMGLLLPATILLNLSNCSTG